MTTKEETALKLIPYSFYRILRMKNTIKNLEEISVSYVNRTVESIAAHPVEKSDRTVDNLNDFRISNMDEEL